MNYCQICHVVGKVSLDSDLGLYSFCGIVQRASDLSEKEQQKQCFGGLVLVGY